nr:MULTISPECIES: hypothetical protein [unclassified Bradyrhizobium]
MTLGYRKSGHGSSNVLKVLITLGAAILLATIGESIGGRLLHSLACSTAAAAKFHLSYGCLSPPEHAESPLKEASHGDSVGQGTDGQHRSPPAAAEDWWGGRFLAAWHAEALIQIGLALVLALGAGRFLLFAEHRLSEHFEITAHPEAASPEAEVLVIPVSWPHRFPGKEFSDSDFDWLVGFARGEPDYSAYLDGRTIASADATLGDLREPGLAIRRNGVQRETFPLENCAWQQALRALYPHLMSETGDPVLARIILLPSLGGPHATSGALAARLQTLIESWIALAARERARQQKTPCKAVVEPETPVNFADAKQISAVYDSIIAKQRRGGKEPRICFDITGGTSAVSAAASIASLRQRVTFSYVAEELAAQGSSDRWKVVFSDFVPMRYTPVKGG